MSEQDIINILEMMMNTYPNTKIADPQAMVKAWELAFGEDDAQSVYMAARHHLNTSKFFPTPADIRKAMNKGQMIYGQNQNPEVKVIEAPKKKIGIGECNYEKCVLYQDLCEGLENGKCPFEGI